MLLMMTRYFTISHTVLALQTHIQTQQSYVPLVEQNECKEEVC